MKPTARVAEAFTFQSRACASLDSPFMARLMALFARRNWPSGKIAQRIMAWEGDLGPRAQSVPLRLSGALHALVLKGHAGLEAVYPPLSKSGEDLWQAISEALVEEADFIDAFIDSAPQTNEVRRSACLIATGHLLADRFGLPLRISELGASGGLNLHWDAYALEIGGARFGPRDAAVTLSPEWIGSLPPLAKPQINSRAGVDLNPLDPCDPADALRLQAYLWPDQPERLAMTRAAMAMAETPVDRADAIDWLVPRLAHLPGHIHLIYSTVAWQYFPADKQTKGRAAIEAAGFGATQEAPLAWFGMENDGKERGAALTLQIWPGGETHDLGRADFHGRWIDWRAPW